MRSVFRASLRSRCCARTRGPAQAAWCARSSVHAILLCGLLCACSSDPWDSGATTSPLAGAAGTGGSTVPPQLPGSSGTATPAQQSATGGAAGIAAAGGMGGTAGHAAGAGSSGMNAPPQSGTGGAGGMGGGAGGASPSGAASFARIYDTLFVSCRSEVCHGGPLDVPGVGLDLQTRDAAYMAIVDRVAAATGPCASSGLMRVVPFKPDESLLFLKYAGKPPCGDAMPPAATNSKENVEQLRAWIAGGALNN